jgi:hypothetical protein
MVGPFDNNLLNQSKDALETLVKGKMPLIH